MGAANVSNIHQGRRSPVREIQETIHQVEANHDDTLEGMSQLITSMIRVGRLAGIAPADGQQVLDRAIESLSTGAKMRALVIATHQDLVEVYGKVNVREMGFGAMGACPNASLEGNPNIARIQVG